jgi:uncharacterized tellurite resistance protein B-like protein
MHIIIGLITAVAGLLWALNSLQNSGLRLSSFNPFYWFRRTKWKKQYQELPLYQIDSPLEVAAVFILGIAKLEGEISREQKAEILRIFSDEFKLSQDDSNDLFASTSYLLQPEHDFIKNIGKILSPTKDKFSEEQAESTIELVVRMANLDSAMSSEQNQVINQLKNLLKPPTSAQTKW